MLINATFKSCLFLFDFSLPGGIRAMESSDECKSFKGFRHKWRRTTSGFEQRVDIGDDEDAVSLRFMDAHETPNRDAPRPAPQSLDDEVELEDNDARLMRLLQHSGLNSEQKGFESASAYEPSIDVRVAFSASEDVGGKSSFVDDTSAVADHYIRGIQRTGFSMPWETPLMKQIFGDNMARPQLSMPMNWGTADEPLPVSDDVGVSQPLIPSDANARYVQRRSDASFLQQREKILSNGIEKWRFIIAMDSSQSETGKQLAGVDDSEIDVILSSVMGVKSPNTILKRANSILMYYRRRAAHGKFPFLPFEEEDVWRYVLWQKLHCGPATRSQGLIQALRFAHFVMGFEGALRCVGSGRIVGQAQIQLSVKTPVRQARPLTAAEVRTLHCIADGTSHSIVDKCVASGLLLALYGRCRISDLNSVFEVLHDVSDAYGFLEISTRHRKSAKTAQQKTWLLPILVSTAGVVEFPWVHSWIWSTNIWGHQWSIDAGT